MRRKKIKKLLEAEGQILYNLKREKSDGPLQMVVYKDGKPGKTVVFQGMQEALQYIEEHAEEIFADILKEKGTHYLVATGTYPESGKDRTIVRKVKIH